MERLRSLIRDIPDFPKPGIVFKDITPLLADGDAFHSTIREMVERAPKQIDRVVAIESRGFIFGAALAHALGVGLVLVRKPKKLPFRTTKIEYALEYGNDTLEMHVDSLASRQRALIVDDVLATGGTAAATAKLIESTGAEVAALVFLMELGFLNGRSKLPAYPIISLLSY